MTLLLTEIGNHGVAMVAESADRCDENSPYTGKPTFHLTYGTQKIVPIARLHCVIGVWGMGMVEAKDFTSTPEVWIADFIAGRDELDSIPAVAEAVSTELIHKPDDPVRFVERW